MVVEVSDTFERMGRQLALGDIVSISRAFFAIADAKNLLDFVPRQIHLY